MMSIFLSCLISGLTVPRSGEAGEESATGETSEIREVFGATERSEGKETSETREVFETNEGLGTKERSVFWMERSWETDFDTARRKAEETSRNLLIYFAAENDSPQLLNDSEESFVRVGKSEVRQISYTLPSMRNPLPIARACREFEQRSFGDLDVLELLDQYVLLKLPVDATVRRDGGETPVLKLPMFQEMLDLPGLAVVDFQHKDAPYHGELVGILPFLRAQIPTTAQVMTFLTLPAGTLTQRTLIYAVRIHQERPLSAMGVPELVLLQEARDHSAYQAKVRVLGHQNFGSRTNRIASALNCIGASEVCAQSWSGEGLFEAAIGCVRAWRGSPGHWKGVRAANRHYGYDMVRGGNGVWYATGLFVK